MRIYPCLWFSWNFPSMSLVVPNRDCLLTLSRCPPRIIQTTGLDARASRVECPAQVVSKSNPINPWCRQISAYFYLSHTQIYPQKWWKFRYTSRPTSGRTNCPLSTEGTLVPYNKIMNFCLYYKSICAESVVYDSQQSQIMYNIHTLGSKWKRCAQIDYL